MRRHGQAGLELMMLVSFSLLVFSGFYLGILKKDVNVVNRQSELQAEEISEKIAFEIRTAKSTGDGYTRNFTLADDIYGVPYSVRIVNNMVLVDIKNSSYASNGFVTNTSGTIITGCNTIRNDRGNISITMC